MLRAIFLFTIGTLAFSLGAGAAEIPEPLKNVGVTEKLGSKVDLSAIVATDEQGKTVSLSQFAHSKKPIAIVLAYYGCPMMCGFVFQGLKKAFENLDWTPGEEFEVVTVSIDPKETPELARNKKKSLLENLDRPFGRPPIDKGWHFLTATEENSKKLAAQVGFNFAYDKIDKQYAHPAVLTLLTPDGTISRYLYGFEYKPRDLRLGLLEASQGQIGTVMDRLVMFCYRYNPEGRGYSLAAFRLVQVGSAGTVVAFGGFFGMIWVRGRKKSRAQKKQK